MVKQYGQPIVRSSAVWRADLVTTEHHSTPIFAGQRAPQEYSARVVAWLGVVIFVLFSLGLSLFFQFDAKRLQARPQLPNLDCWVKVGTLPSGQVLERKTFIVPGTWLRRAQLVQQERHRDPHSGEVSWAGPEQVLSRWYEL